MAQNAATALLGAVAEQSRTVATLLQQRGTHAALLTTLCTGKAL